MEQVVVAPRSPEIVFYKKSPLYGIEFQNALSENVPMVDSQEITVVGMPFFFGVKQPAAPELLYKWSINGTPIYDDGRQMAQIFRQAQETSGASRISLSIENLNKVLQAGRSEFNLTFGQ